MSAGINLAEAERNVKLLVADMDVAIDKAHGAANEITALKGRLSERTPDQRQYEGSTLESQLQNAQNAYQQAQSEVNGVRSALIQYAHRIQAFMKQEEANLRDASRDGRRLNRSAGDRLRESEDPLKRDIATCRRILDTITGALRRGGRTKGGFEPASSSIGNLEGIVDSDARADQGHREVFEEQIYRLDVDRYGLPVKGYGAPAPLLNASEGYRKGTVYEKAKLGGAVPEVQPPASYQVALPQSLDKILRAAVSPANLQGRYTANQYYVGQPPPPREGAQPF